MKYIEFQYGLQATINETDSEIYLCLILVDEDKKNKGLGTAYMKELIDYAVRYNKRLILFPSSFFGGELKRLKKFYTKLGFKQIGKQWEYAN